MDIFKMQYKYRSRYLVVINGDVNVYKDEKHKSEQPFLSYDQKIFLLVNQMFVKSQKFLGRLILVLILMVILFYFNVKITNTFIFLN